MVKSQRSYALQVTTNDKSILTIDFENAPFTLEFDIKRNNLQSTNVAQIKIYNLSEAHRQQIAKDEFQYDVYRLVQLNAGYGTNRPVIFKGNANHIWSVREGVNFVTTIEAFDGGDALINSTTNKSFAAGTPIPQVLRSIAGDLKNVKVGAIGAYTGALPRGNTYSGTPADHLTTLTNGGFYIDNEKVFLLNDDECVLGELFVINSAAGLLNTPIRSKQMIYFDILFEPRIVMCQQLILQSITDKNFNGQYKVISISHRGTISDSVAGDAVTSLGMWQGPNGGAFKTVGSL